MKGKNRSIEQIVEEQVKRWQLSRKKEPKRETPTVITVSREPGSGGQIIAETVAQKLEYDYFHQEVLHRMADSSQTSVRLLETLDEKGLSTLEESISSIVNERHLWPDQYLHHLMKIVGTIGKHGGAVIVGRGANFVIPQSRLLRIRVIAPRDMRVTNVAKEHAISVKEARRRILRTEANRKAFVRKYFYADIENPVNYDLIVNTGNTHLSKAVEIVISAVK